jgi:BMFP domain-containing protein YqiC
MALPKQIREQTEAISKFYEEATAEGDTTATEQGTSGEGSPGNEEADGAEGTAPAAAPNEQGRPATTVDDTAEQRYRTLQGMYNADTARLRADKQELTARIEQLENLLSSLSTRPAQGQTPPTNEKLVTQKDIDEYGDSIEVMRRVTKEETGTYQSKIADLERTLNDLRAQVIPRVEQVAQRQARTVEQAFWSDLSTAVPDW